MFDLEFLSALFFIIAIDIVLGGDNAVVIAMASRTLPVEQKKKAVLWGTGLAIVVRILTTILAAFVLKIPYLFLVGGLVLVWVSYKLLVDEEGERNIKPGDNLVQAVKTIVVADIAMGLDNVLAIAGAAKGEIGLIVLGLLISIPIMIWGSHLILNAMERFGWLVYAGAGILAWTSARMILHEPAVTRLVDGMPWLAVFFQAAVVAGVLGLGYKGRKRSRPADSVDEPEREEDDEIATGS